MVGFDCFGGEGEGGEENEIEKFLPKLQIWKISKTFFSPSFFDGESERCVYLINKID